MTKTTDTKLKIYPSSSGFSDGDSYEVEYNSSCLRFLVVSQGIKKDIAEEYQVIGALHEDWWAKQLEGQKFEREVPYKKQYGLAEYSGRVDFDVEGPEIHETKASMSKNVLYKTIRKKEVKLGHLAQLVSYMVHKEVENGKIIVGFYKKKKDKFELQEHTIFDIKIDETGNILVNGDKHYFTAIDAIRFLFMQVKYLNSGGIGPRPKRIQWKDPCRFCPLNTLCDAYDFSDNKSESKFKTDARTILLGETTNDDDKEI